ncbi:MAG: hypothetical protein EBW38_12260 [Rhodobacteraceae bacterium]|jgi:hypothetical protein|nr:hypothetical protein [Paracoccaceae bacterium]
MKYGRVVNIEFKSKEDLVMFRNKWSNWWPEKATPVLSRTSIRTSENSLLLLAIYESEEKAEEARQVVDIFFQENTEHTHDLIVFHGEVMNDEPYAVMT